jgi:hypothetical protein
MKKEFYERMVSDPDGQISSTRVMAWSKLKFFYWFNILFMLIFGAITWATTGLGQVQLGVVWILAICWWVIDAYLLLAIYAPKQLAKQLEVTKIIELAKTVAEKSIK